MKAAISDLLDKEDYDDGSLGPIFVRLAWHASGTYDKNTNTGGSNGATMRCEPHTSHGTATEMTHCACCVNAYICHHPWKRSNR